MKPLSKKRPEASAPAAGRAEGTRSLSGVYSAGLWNERHAALLGKVAASMPQVEELMTELAARLLGGPATAPRAMFRGLRSDAERVKVLRSLVEHAELSARTERACDLAVAEWAVARRRWRTYRDGLWYTHEGGRSFLAAPAKEDATGFLVAREVKSAELEVELARVTELTETLRRLVEPGASVRAPSAGAGRRRRKPRAPEAGKAKRTAPTREAGARRKRKPVRPDAAPAGQE